MSYVKISTCENRSHLAHERAVRSRSKYSFGLFFKAGGVKKKKKIGAAKREKLLFLQLRSCDKIWLYSAIDGGKSVEMWCARCRDSATGASRAVAAAATVQPETPTAGQGWWDHGWRPWLWSALAGQPCFMFTLYFQLVTAMAGYNT